MFLSSNNNKDTTEKIHVHTDYKRAKIIIIDDFTVCHIWAKVKAVWEPRFRLGSKTRRLGSKDPGKPGSGCAACEAVFASTAQTFNATSRFIMC